MTKSPVDEIIERAFDVVLRKNARTYWTAADVLREAQRDPHLSRVLTDLATRHHGWYLDRYLIAHIRVRIGRLHQAREPETELRLYESVSIPGKSERRWMLLSRMTAATLRDAMKQTRTQEHVLHLKGEGYHIILALLDKATPTTTVDDVLAEAMPLIRAYRRDQAAS